MLPGKLKISACAMTCPVPVEAGCGRLRCWLDRVAGARLLGGCNHTSLMRGFAWLNRRLCTCCCRSCAGSGGRAILTERWRWPRWLRRICIRRCRRYGRRTILPGYRMANWTASSVALERTLRREVRASLHEWAVLALGSQGQVPAAHHRLVIRELEAVALGQCDRLMLLLPPGSAKSTYAVLNVLLGTLGAMATSVVGYWVGSSAGSARKDARLAARDLGAGG